MSAYEPPIENVPEFDVLLFRQDDTPLTIGTASKLFLRYPNAQGEENLAKTNVSGLLTANGGIATGSIDSITPTGAENLFSSHTGIINLGISASRTGNLNIGTGGSGAITVGNATNNTTIADVVFTAGTAYRAGNFYISGGSASTTRLGNNATSGAVNISNGQTSGATTIANNATRNYSNSTSTGEISIGTGSATGSGANGCVINIGTGARTINSAINIGTGTRDGTSDINIGIGATNAGHLHLQDGNQNSGNIHIGNGTFNTGNVNIANGAGTGSGAGQQNTGSVNILTGAYNIGDCNINTSATGGGDTFIGNSAGTGTLYLNSHTMDIGTNGDSTTILNLNAPLRPNYSGTVPNADTMIGYLYNPTANTLTAPATTVTNICNFTLTNGVWMCSATATLSNFSTTAGNFLRVSLSKTSATEDANTRQDYASDNVGGTVYCKASGIFQCTGASTTIYYTMRVGTVGTVSTTAVNIQAVRIA